MKTLFMTTALEITVAFRSPLLKVEYSNKSSDHYKLFMSLTKLNGNTVLCRHIDGLVQDCSISSDGDATVLR